MLFLLINNTSDTYSFSNDTVQIGPNGTLQVSFVEWFKLSEDLDFREQVRLRNITITDKRHHFSAEELPSVMPVVASSRVLGSLGNYITELNPLPISNTKRLAQVRNRNFVSKSISNTTGLIHTVAPGKVFFLTALGISALNTSSTNPQLLIRDGVTVKLPFLWQQMPILGQPQPFNFFSNFEHNPIPFLQDVNAFQAAGTISASVFVIGYEE